MESWSLRLLRCLRYLCVIFFSLPLFLPFVSPSCVPPPGCVSCWCPCITYGKVKRRYDHLNRRGSPDPEHGGCFTSDCMIHGAITYCGFGWVMQVCVSFVGLFKTKICETRFLFVVYASWLYQGAIQRQGRIVRRLLYGILVHALRAHSRIARARTRGKLVW